MALVSKHLETAGLVRNWTSLDGLKPLRAVVCVSDAGSDQKKCRQYLLELARHSVWLLFFESDCFMHKLALVLEAQLRYGDEFVSAWLLVHTGEVDEFREGYFHGKEDSVRVVRFVLR